LLITMLFSSKSSETAQSEGCRNSGGRREWGDEARQPEHHARTRSRHRARHTDAPRSWNPCEESSHHLGQEACSATSQKQLAACDVEADGHSGRRQRQRCQCEGVGDRKSSESIVKATVDNSASDVHSVRHAHAEVQSNDGAMGQAGSFFTMSGNQGCVATPGVSGVSGDFKTHIPAPNVGCANEANADAAGVYGEDHGVHAFVGTTSPVGTTSVVAPSFFEAQVEHKGQQLHFTLASTTTVLELAQMYAKWMSVDGGLTALLPTELLQPHQTSPRSNFDSR